MRLLLHTSTAVTFCVYNQVLFEDRLLECLALNSLRSINFTDNHKMLKILERRSRTRYDAANHG